MNIPFSVPAPQPPPNQVSYGIESLSLFQSYTRDSYQGAFGVEAPAWDPARVRKAWFDSSVDVSNPSSLISYRWLHQDAAGDWTVRLFQLPVLEAASVNLPGAMRYPPYVVAPTGAVRDISPVSPLYLSFEADAKELMLELKGSSIFDEGAQGAFPVLYPAGEQRRMWVMKYGTGQNLNVGLLLESKNAKGFGAPGHWDASAGTPIWVPDGPAANGLEDVRPPCPVPVRALLASEELRPIMTGIGAVGVQVVRTDLEQEVAERSGAFLASDRLILRQILSLLTPSERF